MTINAEKNDGTAVTVYGFFADFYFPHPSNHPSTQSDRIDVSFVDHFSDHATVTISEKVLRTVPNQQLRYETFVLSSEYPILTSEEHKVDGLGNVIYTSEIPEGATPGMAKVIWSKKAD